MLTGEVAIVSFTVSNLGTRDTFARTWVDDVFLSKDGIFDSGDLKLFSVTRTSGLSVGQSYSVTKGVVISETMVPGNYTIFVRTDRPEALFGGDPFANLEFEGPGEANNQSALPVSIGFGPTADLVVSNVTAPVTAFAGSSILVNFTVENVGDKLVVGDRTDAIYLSLDPVFDRNTDRFLGFVESSASVRRGDRAMSPPTCRFPLDSPASSLSSCWRIAGMMFSSEARKATTRPPRRRRSCVAGTTDRLGRRDNQYPRQCRGRWQHRD